MTLRGAALAVMLLGAGCGTSHSGDSGPTDAGAIPLPPFPLERREVELSDEEFREFCEWWTAQWYSDPEDRSFECLDGGAMGRYISVEGCILTRPDPATTPDCSFTIGDWYECISVSPDRCMAVPLECRRPEGCGVPAIWI